MRFIYMTVFSLFVSGLFAQSPRVTLDKTESTSSIGIGNTITQTFTITNTGNRDLEWEILTKGLPVYFYKAPYSNWNEGANQDRISSNVWITRKDNQGLFNIAQESAFDGTVSPAGTKWAFGRSAELSAENYEVWQTAVSNNPQSMVNKMISLQLTESNRYFDLLFQTFSGNNSGGGFSYVRTEYFLPWISMDNSSGTLLPGQSEVVTLTLNSADLLEGLNEGLIVITSNDVVSPETTLKVNLNVTGGTADINVSGSVDFGSTVQNTTTHGTLWVNNVGTGSLSITNVTSSSIAFEPALTEFVVPPGKAFPLDIAFTPTIATNYTSTLTLTSNDPDEPSQNVILSGIGIASPSIHLDTESVSASLMSGDSTGSIITVSNLGSNILDYAVEFDLGTSEPITFTKKDFADPRLPENQDRVSQGIWLTRDFKRGLYNAAVDSAFDDDFTPSNTLWSNTNTANSEDYDVWINAMDGGPRDYIGVVTSMYATEEDRYFDIELQKWTCCENGGGFSYTRTEIYNWATASYDGSVAAGESEEVAVSFNTAGLPAGTYNGTIRFVSNDPQNPEISIPVSLTVSGSALASVYDTLVNFGEVGAGLQGKNFVRVINNGVVPFEVTSITSDDGAVVVLDASGTVPALGMKLFELQFSPTSQIVYAGNITVLTNEPSNPSFVIPFEGTGIAPGELTVSAPDMSTSVATGTTSSKTFTIENTGDGELSWSLGFKNDNPVINVLKGDYADWTLAENQDRIAEDVWLTRRNEQGLFNIAVESSYEYDFSPANTLWAWGNTHEVSLSEYTDWVNAIDYDPLDMLEETLSLHVGQKYYDVTFTSWTSHGQGGGFAYTRKEVAGWLKVDQDGGVLAPGSSTTVTVTYDPADYVPGTYQESLLITTNDPANPTYELPVEITVLGAPLIVVSKTNFDFGTLPLNSDSTQVFTITNEGTSTLEVTGIASDNAAFSLSTTNATLGVNESLDVVVKFLPTVVGSQIGELSIYSNDALSNPILISVSGIGVQTPNIAVTPSQIRELTPITSVFDGAITIANTGDVDLNWVAPHSDVTLEQALGRLNERYTSITNIIPSRYDFVYDGVNNIGDGGNDMYDGGNYLNTNLASTIPYTENVIAEGTTYFGTSSRYFTMKLPGLFVLGADMNGITSFRTSGNNGADGGGFTDATEINFALNKKEYTAYVKQVYSAGDPSINQVMLIETNGSAVHTYATHTDNNEQQLAGLETVSRLYYLLYSRTSGGYINDLQNEAIIKQFISVINGGVMADWVELDSYSGTVAPGETFDVSYHVDLTSYASGNYQTIIPFTSNDMDGNNSSVALEINLGGVSVVNPIADVLLNEGFGTHVIEFSNVFLDGNGDALSYLTGTSDISIVTPAITGTELTVTETGTGTAIVSIRADDGSGNVTFEDFNFRVNDVPNVANPIPMLAFERGFGSGTIDVSDVFSDSDDQDELSFSISNSNNLVATASISGDVITITEVGLGTTTITLNVTDGSGGTTSTTFEVVVEKAVADIEVANTEFTYDGAVKSVAVSTVPSGLVTAIEYSQNGIVVEPVNAGVYDFVISIDDENYQGSYEGTISIAKATPVVTFADLAKTYGDAAFNLDASSSNGMAVNFSVVPDETSTGIISLSGTNNATVEIVQAGNVKIKATLPESSNYAGAEVVANLSIERAHASISFDNINKTYNDTPFSLSASSYAGSIIDFAIDHDHESTGAIILSGERNENVEILQAGVVHITATAAETVNYYGATKGATLTIAKAVPVIVFNDISKTYGDEPFGLVAETYDGGVINFGVVADPSNTGEVALSGANNAQVSITQAGTVTIKADVAETTNYTQASATAVLTIAKATPTISFNDIEKTYGDAAFSLEANSNSEGVIQFTVVNESVNTGEVSLSGENNSLATILKAGDVAIKAEVLETVNYSSASVTSRLTISKATPEINFENIVKRYGDADFDLAATSYPGASITYSIDADGGDVILSGARNETVSIESAGVVTLRATVSATENYFSAEKTATLTILRGTTTVTFEDITKTYGDADFDLSATAYPGATLVYSVVEDQANTAQVILNGSQLSIIRAGTIKLKASVAQNDSFEAGEKTILLTINKSNQTINFADVADVLNTDAPFTITATASSGLAVSFNVISGPASVTNNVVSLSGTTGTVVIEAVQAGNENYNQASSQQTFNVSEDPILEAEDPFLSFVEVWPVPADETINVSAGALEMMEVTLIDNMGRTFYQYTPNATNFAFSVRELAGGIYNLLITTPKGNVVRRVVIK